MQRSQALANREGKRGRCGGVQPEPQICGDSPVVTLHPTDRAGFSIAEVARMLGCSNQTISDAVNCGELPAWHLGRRVIIPKSALEFGPRVDLHVDVEALARSIRLETLRAQRRAIELEIGELEGTCCL